MLHRILTLLDLAITARAIKLTPPQQPTDFGDSLPSVPPGELRTSDHIVFDTLAWRPTCADLKNYTHTGPDGTLHFGANGSSSMEFCNQYERRLKSSMRTNIASQQKPIQFLHVSKSGGTFVCMCGNYQGGRNKGLPLDPVLNCHFLEEDWPSWGGVSDVPAYASRVFRKSPCESLERQYRDWGVTLEANENYVGHGGRLCAQFETALVMRSPLHRLASHIAWIHGPVPENVSALTVREILGRWPRLSNNYFARSLSDASVFYAALDALPESLYEDARRTLEQFDHVFVMEQELAAGLGQAFGWDCQRTPGRGSPLPNGTQSIVDRWREAWPQEDWQLLEEKNAVDMRLFREVQVLSFARGLQAFAKAAA